MSTIQFLIPPCPECVSLIHPSPADVGLKVNRPAAVILMRPQFVHTQFINNNQYVMQQKNWFVKSKSDRGRTGLCHINRWYATREIIDCQSGVRVNQCYPTTCFFAAPSSSPSFYVATDHDQNATTMVVVVVILGNPSPATALSRSYTYIVGAGRWCHQFCIVVIRFGWFMEGMSRGTSGVASVGHNKNVWVLWMMSCDLWKIRPLSKRLRELQWNYEMASLNEAPPTEGN